jgi:hypothetical protein
MLGWLLRAIVLTIIVNLILRLIFSGTRPSQSRRDTARGPMPGRQSRPEQTGGTLVQDPQCGTYIVPARALRSGSGTEAHYFCSDGCRTAYLAAHPQ